MTSKEKIVRFMEEKNKIIKKHTGIIYFNKKDKEAILRWNNDCNKIYKQIIYCIYKINVCGLGAGTCPFCLIYYNHCDKCEYRKNHGICCTPIIKNDYDDIKECFEKLKLNIYNIFSNDVYKEIINKIECE